MNIEKFVQEMIKLLPQITRGFAHYEHNYLTKGEITLPQFWVLDYLYRNKTAKMSELAQYLGTTRPAITGLVDRLIIQKLVNRKDDPDDRRIVWIELTSRGNNIIRKIKEQKTKALIKIFSRISSKDRIHYLNIIEQVVKIVNNLPK